MTANPGSSSRRRTRAGVRVIVDGQIDEAARDSFPASDPPGWSVGPAIGDASGFLERRRPADAIGPDEAEGLDDSKPAG